MPKDGRDRRIVPRHQVLGHVQIIGRTGPINCVVRDLSESGARLGVSGRAKLPPTFDLWLVQRKLKLRVRMKWRNGDHVGVAFCEPQKAFKPPTAGGEQVLVDV